jgi:hypothetical protein
LAPEQPIVAGEFANELITLGVLLAPETAPDKVVVNAPLFCLPKPGQPGQWRVLADMMLGCQNEDIGSDPTTFPHSDVILSQMCSGGHSAVVNASKFFCQFQTHPDEYKYLGLIQVCRTIRAYFTHLQDDIVLQTGRELRMRKYFEFLLPFFRAK